MYDHKKPSKTSKDQKSTVKEHEDPDYGMVSDGLTRSVPSEVTGKKG